MSRVAWDAVAAELTYFHLPGTECCPVLTGNGAWELGPGRRGDDVLHL